MAGWNKDYKAGPIPQTDAEREAAAKKYHLLPEEYKPYADNGMGYGDYPELKGGLGVEARDAFYPYDYPELKRNYQETVSVSLYLKQQYNFIFLSPCSCMPMPICTARIVGHKLLLLVLPTAPIGFVFWPLWLAV